MKQQSKTGMDQFYYVMVLFCAVASIAALLFASVHSKWWLAGCTYFAIIIVGIFENADETKTHA